MQTLADIIGNVMGSIRFLFLLFFCAIMGIGLLLTAGTSYVAPQVAENVADRAERVTNRAIEAAEEAHRNEQLAQEGWGYGAGNDSSSSDDDWGASK